jgi:hypothetical protein
MVAYSSNSRRCPKCRRSVVEYVQIPKSAPTLQSNPNNWVTVRVCVSCGYRRERLTRSPIARSAENQPAPSRSSTLQT